MTGMKYDAEFESHFFIQMIDEESDVVENFLWGKIIKDYKNRFADNRHIYTSSIQEIVGDFVYGLDGGQCACHWVDGLLVWHYDGT